MNSPGRLQQCGARRIDYRCLCSLDQRGVRLERVAGAKFLHDRRLRPDVPGRETGRAEFVERRIGNADRVGIDGRTFEMTRQCNYLPDNRFLKTFVARKATKDEFQTNGFSKGFI
jgi:hypothetical protein